MIQDQKLGPVLVVAPHPDDETLGAGGFLLRCRDEGRAVHWLIVTAMNPDDGWHADKIKKRSVEIANVAAAYEFESVTELGFATAKLDTVPKSELIAAIGEAVNLIEPETILIPHRDDAHSDHAAVHDAAAACCKWFRYPTVKDVLVYETLSETDAAIHSSAPFHPTLFIDITNQIEMKLKITSMYGDEIGEMPFPRSLTAIEALATVRGAASGYLAAESFMILRSRS